MLYYSQKYIPYIFLILLLQKSSKLKEKKVQENSDFLKMNLLIFAIVSCFVVRVRVIK